MDSEKKNKSEKTKEFKPNPLKAMEETKEHRKSVYLVWADSDKTQGALCYKQYQEIDLFLVIRLQGCPLDN